MSLDIDRLSTALSRLDGFEALLACDRLTGGASQEMYCLQVRLAGQKTRLALRRSQATNIASEHHSMGQISTRSEARLMAAMHACGVPTPRILLELLPEDQLGDGFIMQWMQGETLGARICRSDKFAGVRPHLAHDFGATLARIHAVNAHSSGLADLLHECTPEQLVHESWDYYKSLNVAQPMIDFTARWLLDHLPRDHAVTVVHGDYRNGNVMVDADGIVAVLDWEIAHLGDPVRDLGWLCVNSWRFGNHALPVGGFGTREQLLAGYQSVSGIAVDRGHLRFWEVFGSFWWAVACLKLANTYRTGENLSPERPAIGRRTSEAQMDCVNLIIPGNYRLPANEHATGQTQNLPLAQEILASIGHWLKNDIAADTASRNRFLARVSANALAIVEREINLGPQLLQEERLRLQSLLNDRGELDNLRWRLTRELRQTLPLDSAGLANHLRQTVAGQLAIDQPGYSALS